MNFIGFALLDKSSEIWIFNEGVEHDFERFRMQKFQFFR